MFHLAYIQVIFSCFKLYTVCAMSCFDWASKRIHRFA
jgi:hypothetical protein